MRDHPATDVELLDLRVTIVLCLSAGVLSIREFFGADMSLLHSSYPETLTEPWRLLTSCLLHGSWIHLGFNLYWTFRFGSIVEPVLGLFGTSAFVLLLAATSAAAQWAFTGGAVGLSGIGYGLFGILWALSRYHPNFRGVIDDGLTRLFVGWFFLCIVLTLGEIQPIANVAHGTGAVMGALVGVALSPTGMNRRLAWLTVSVLTIFIGSAATIARPYVNFSEHRVFELQSDAYNALKADMPQRAIEYLERAVELDEKSAHSWHNLAVAYSRVGRLRDADSAMARSEALEMAEKSENRMKVDNSFTSKPRRDP